MINFSIDLDKVKKTNDLKKIADYWQRKSMLNCAERNTFGRILCIITNKWLDEDKLDVCHIMDRGKMCTRYYDDNVFLGSSYSNRVESGEHIKGDISVHHRKIYDILGEKKIQSLKLLSEQRCLLSREDLVNIINKFKQRCQETKIST